jgi:NADPH:quinone reductase-like Zn-dependent oxidoreductase
MRAVRFHEYGGFDELRVDEVDGLTPGEGEVLISVRAAGVNPIDWKRLHGFLASVAPLDLPAGLGSDVAGVVEQVGAEVSGFAVGDAVLGSSSSPAYAEQALCLAEKLVPKPAGVEWPVAGSLAVVIGTAYKVLQLLKAQRGETLLIHAASGGVGLAATQLALARGVRVIGTAGQANQALLGSLGATPVLYGDGLRERLLELASDGVDAVLDASGRGELGLSVELAGGPERVITIAAPDAAEHGVIFHTSGGGASTVPALEEVLPLIADGSFVFPLARTFSLDQVGQALEASETGHAAGKLVVLPA